MRCAGKIGLETGRVPVVSTRPESLETYRGSMSALSFTEFRLQAPWRILCVASSFDRRDISANAGAGSLDVSRLFWWQTGVCIDSHRQLAERLLTVCALRSVLEAPEPSGTERGDPERFVAAKPKGDPLNLNLSTALATGAQPVAPGPKRSRWGWLLPHVSTSTLETCGDGAV